MHIWRFFHFGHATFVTDRDDKHSIAHELRHSYQMEKRGNRISYIYSYLEQSGGINYDAPGYFENEYELDAYYTQYLHKEGLIDKYGNKKGNIDHESLAADFYKWMKDRYEDKGNFNLDSNWVWKQSIYHGRDYE